MTTKRHIAKALGAADKAVEPAEAEVKALTTYITPFVEEALALEVTSPLEYTAAAEVLKDVKIRLGEVDDLRRSLTRPLDEAKKRIMDLFRPPEAALKEAERTLKGAMLDFQGAERRRLAEEQVVAEAEREKEATRLAKLAAAAEKRDQPAKAAALRDMAVALPEATAAPPTQVSGISTRVIYSAEVTDFEALVKAVAGGTFPLGLLLPNQPALNALARASKNGEITVPGVSVRKEQSMAAGR